MATPPDSYAWLRDGTSYSASASSSASCTTSSSPTATYYSMGTDEGTTDSNAAYYLNDSTGCIAPGTMVQIANPGQIIPVRSMDHLGYYYGIDRLSMDPRVVEAEDRRRRENMERAQSQMEGDVARAILQENDLQRTQPRSAQEAMQAQEQVQQQASLQETMRRLERDMERATQMYPLPQAVPPEAVPEGVEVGEEMNAATYTTPPSHHERMRLEQQWRYLEEQQRRNLVRHAAMYPGSADNNVNPYRGQPVPPPRRRPAMEPGRYYGIRNEGLMNEFVCYDEPDTPRPIPPTPEVLKKREKAEEKAQELLGMMIGGEDLDVYKKTGNLYVKGKKHEYIIQKDGYILQLKKDRVVNLCCHLERKNSLPLTDNVIAMKLSLENDEKKVLGMANEWGSQNRETWKLPECAGMVA